MVIPFDLSLDYRILVSIIKPSLKLTNYISTICILLLITSCQKDIYLEYENFESNLVINGIFNPNDQWQVDISKSANLLDVNSYIEKIEDAYVTVENLETGLITELVHTSNATNKGTYYSAFRPREDASYRIIVEKDGFTTASAVDQIPTDIDVVFLDTSLVEVEGELALKIDFKINDNASEENFYVWDLLYTQEEGNNNDILPSVTDATLESVDDNAEILNEENNFQSKLFLRDDNFNGVEYNTSFFTYNEEIVENSNPSSTETETDLKLQLRVLSVSKDLYNYLKSVEASYRSQNLNTSNINPLDINSNVEGGLGIFGAYKMHLIDIE